MKIPDQPAELKKLESAAVAAMKIENFVNALDFYEEIEAKGWAHARHFTAQGFCLIKVRRRKDAARILLKAFNLDPNENRCIELLNKYVPGWEKRAAEYVPESVDNTSPQAAYSPAVPPPVADPAPVAPQESAPVAPEPAPVQPTPHHQPQQSAPAPTQDDFSTMKICWKYVLDDTHLEAAN
jgi:hypothetical protein